MQVSRFVRFVRTRFGQRMLAARQLASLASHVSRPHLVQVLVLHVLVGVMPILFVVGIGKALESLAAEAANEGGWLLLALSAFVVQQVLAPWQTAASYVVGRDVDTYCSTRLMRFALTQAPLQAIESPELAAELGEANRALDDMTMTPGAATEGALALTARYTQLVGAVAIIAVTAGLRAALLGAVIALMQRRGQTSAYFRWGQLVRSFNAPRKRMAYLRELGTSTRAAKEIRTLGLLNWVEDRYVAESDAYLHPLWSWRRRVYGPPFVLYALLGLVGTLGLMLVLAGSDTRSPLQVGGLTMALQAALLCARFGVMFPESDMKMVYGRAAWSALLEVERFSTGTAPQPAAAMIPSPRPAREIRFADVHFAYAADRPVLAGLDLVLPVGTSTAVVGVNGAGKTTTVKLLTALYRPTSGTISCDGVDLANVTPADWQRNVAVTFQDYVRYEMSLRDNIAMGAVEHRDDDVGIVDALVTVGLGDLLATLQDGIETPLTRAFPGGRDLSGGEWQRVALARSLFAVRHGACVLVLDEPTAQLDARGEAEFYETFLELTRGVTSLVISHRFSSVRRADRIVVLEDGRVSEVGSHDELVELAGRYAELFDVQARRFAPTRDAS